MPYLMFSLPTFSFSPNRSTELAPHSRLLTFKHRRTVGFL